MLGTIVAYCLGTVILLLASLFLLYTAYIFYVHHKYSHLPSPKLPSFYLGHIPDIIRLRKEQKNPDLPLSEICEYWMQKAGSRNIVVYVFHKARIFTADPKVIKILVMNVNNNKAKFFSQAFGNLYGERFLGNGIVTVKDYDTWKPKRKIYDPAFNKSYLKGLVPRFNSLVDDFLEKLKPLADGKTVVPLKDHIQDFVLDVVSKIMFDTDFTKAQPSTVAVPPGYPNIFSYIIYKVLKGGGEALNSLYPPWMHYFHPFEAKGYQEAVRAFRQMGRDCIQKRIKAIKDGENNSSDILTHILQSASLKETLSMEDLLDDFGGFYLGGYDTSAGLLQFSIILILQHPEVLSRLLDEINEVLGDKNTVSAEDIEGLKYTEQVLYETLRMYSIVGGIMKTVDSDLTVSNKVFPAHSEFMLMTSTMNYMPEYFENPDLFNPDRFGPGMNPSSFVYFPFGVGHRACIGKHFAMMEAKIFLARLLQTYNLTLPDDYELITVQKTFLHPKDNIPCTLRSM